MKTTTTSSVAMPLIGGLANVHVGPACEPLSAGMVVEPTQEIASATPSPTRRKTMMMPRVRILEGPEARHADGKEPRVADEGIAGIRRIPIDLQMEQRAGRTVRKARPAERHRRIIRLER